MISVPARMKEVFRRSELQALGPIGLDLAQEKLHLVQMERAGSGLNIRAFASLPYPGGREELLASPKALRALLREALGSQTFKGKRVVTSLPGRGTRLINLSYRAAPGGDDAEAIVQGVLGRTGASAEELVIDYLPIRQPEKGAEERTALAAVARREEVVAYLDLLAAAGLEVSALDLGPAALKRLVMSADREGEHPTVLLVNFGRENSYLTVIAGQRLILDREISLGEEELSKRLGRGLGMEPGQALKLLYNYGFARGGAKAQEQEILESIAAILKPVFLEFVDEVNKVQLYTSAEMHGLIVSRVYLIGGLARCPGIDAFLARQLGLPAAILSPFEHFRVRSEDAMLVALNDPASIALAAGLALRGIVDHA